jgi:High potential iron-sulfur protein
MSRSKTSGGDESRRRFITLVGTTGAAVLVGARPNLGFAQGGGLPHVSPSDPTAQALGYTEDASKVDKSKFTAYKPGAHCATCNFFQGKASDSYGPCQIFPGKAVAAAGWCASHSPKA